MAEPVYRMMKIRVAALVFLFIPAAAHASTNHKPAQPVVSAAAVLPTDVFSLQHQQLYLDGKPYVEMSFNKFDLLWQIWGGIQQRDKTGDASTLDAAIKEQDAELRDLHQMGFRTVRIFGAPFVHDAASFAQATSTAQLFEAIDTMLDLCDKNQMQLVFSLGLGSFAYDVAAPVSPKAAPQPIPLYADQQSKSRSDCYAYIDAIVGRYKGRKAIAMWEVSNELTNIADIGVRNGSVSPTLSQIAEFFDSTAARIHRDDSLRLVSTGGSVLRESAWHLSQHLGWPKDSLHQYKSAYAAYFQSSAINVVDTHYYALHDGGFTLAPDAAGKPVVMTPAQYVSIVHSFGKGAIIGEYGTLPSAWDSSKSNPGPDWFAGYHDANAVRWVQAGVDDLVKAKPSLAYWWAYQSDRPMDQHANPVTFSRQTTPDLLKIIIEGNRRLKAALGAQ